MQVLDSAGEGCIGECSCCKPKPPKEVATKAEGAEGAEEGAEGAADDAAAAEAEMEMEQEQEPEDEGGYEVRSLVYVPGSDRPSAFYAAFGGNASGMVYGCEVGSEEVTEVMKVRDDVAISFMGKTLTGNGLVIGSDDGHVRYQPSEGFVGITSGMPQPWEDCMHDSTRGAVTSVSVSYDDMTLLSAAKDGTVAVMSVDDSLFKEKRSVEFGEINQPPQMESEPSPGVDDITDDAHYTIEEDKQRREEDRLIALAEEKKLSVRDHIAKLRDEFNKIIADNEKLPQGVRLDSTELEVDIGLREMVAADTAQKVETARLELQWESERRRVALRKIRARRRRRRTTMTKMTTRISTTKRRRRCARSAATRRCTRRCATCARDAWTRTRWLPNFRK